MTSVPSVYVFKDTQLLPKAVAEYIVAQQKHAINKHHRFMVGVSGGSLVKVLKEGLLNNPDVDFTKWEIFFADERLVPLENEDSNYGLLKKQLLDHIPEDKQPKVFPIATDKLDDALETADEYEKILVKQFAAKDTVKLPTFDLLLLGAGPDGHTCSLFPNNEILRENIAWIGAVEDSPKPPPRRITLTFPVVLNASNIAFVATGASKAPILKVVFEEPEKRLPCSVVNEDSKGKVVWFVDEDAVTDVSVSKKDWKL